ncbi:MAG TPA: transglycosylase SLT domain-containing protein [Xanthomonadaceae bacterium]|nr:transglycosylase SLT domain-containing protein [Xanthomonadaceae bacterium]
MPIPPIPPRVAGRLSTTPAAVLCALLLAAPLLPPPAHASAPALRAAFEAAARGETDAARKAGLADHPLAGWIEYAALVEGIDDLAVARGTDFLARHRGQPVAAAFREAWLKELADREDWRGFRAAWAPGVESVALTCHSLQARQATGAADAAWDAQAQQLWREAGESLPEACDPVFDALEARGALTPALRWARLEAAAVAGSSGLMKFVARDMPASDRALGEQYAAYVANPDGSAASWPKTTRSRLIASHALAHLARSDPGKAEAVLPPVASALGFDAAERARVLYQVALWSVASYLPESARRLAAVPASAYDARLHEWRVREALARKDWAAALAAIRAMPASQRSDSKYAYFEGRLAALTGDESTARARYAAAARAPDYHGFLAADRIEAPYALCPWQPEHAPADVAKVASDASLQRALLLYGVDRPGWAAREWKDALTRFDDDQRLIAIARAQDAGWFDRAVFYLGDDNPDELRLYHLRFPLEHEALIRREAKRHDLDPAWIAAQIRAESTFTAHARSAADARGLMQVLPATGAAVARKLGRPWRGGASLYEPETNIVLGTAYLRQQLDKHGTPYFAIAAYNAGPTPVARWQAERPGLDPDFWIETISYHETRDYVPRVLAFSVLYDWRLDGKARRLSDRLAGRFDGQRKDFRCPVP